MSEDQSGDNTPSHDETVAPSTTPEAEAETKIEAEGSVAEESGQVKKPNKVQERINQLTREKHEARQKNAELEQRLKSLETKNAETKEPELVVPLEDSFDSDSDYQKAHAQYVANTAAAVAYDRLSAENETRDQASRQQARDTELATKAKTFAANLESKRSAFQDFEDVAYNHAFIDTDLAEQLLDMDKGPEVAYHLGSHLDDAERIFSLPPVQRARELTKLEFTLEAVKPNKVSGAPDPITPLGNSESVNFDPDKLTADEWRAYRNKQIYG